MVATGKNAGNDGIHAAVVVGHLEKIQDAVHDRLRNALSEVYQVAEAIAKQMGSSVSDDVMAKQKMGYSLAVAMAMMKCTNYIFYEMGMNEEQRSAAYTKMHVTMAEICLGSLPDHIPEISREEAERMLDKLHSVVADNENK